jgi:hypothetical protein
MKAYTLLMNCHLGRKGSVIEVEDNEARQLAVNRVIDFPVAVSVTKVISSIAGDNQSVTEVIEPKVQKVNGPEITKIDGPEETKRRGRPRKADASNTAD